MAAPMRVDVAIVGAGLAGLVAARELVRRGRSVLVLEARDRVGGRVENHPVARGEVVDLGGQWITARQQAIRDLAEDLGVEIFPSPREGKDLAPHLASEARAEIARAIAELDALSRSVPTAAPWSAPRAREWESQTLQSWLDARVASDEARVLLAGSAEGYLAVPARAVSLLHFLFYGRANGGMGHLLGDEGQPQNQERFDGGSQLLALRMAQALGDAVQLSRPVRRVRQDAAGVEIEADGLAVGAEHAIVALPPPLAGRLRYDPPLPPLRDHLTQRVTMGSGFKMHAVYEAPFWRDDGLSGNAVDSEGGAMVFDGTPRSGRPGVLTAFLPIDRSWADLSAPPSERRRRVLACFARYFGPRAEHPDDYVERMWATEEYIRGEVCVFPPGSWIPFGRALREPVGRIHWAGAETATEFPGQTEGAVRSGLRAAAELLR